MADNPSNIVPDNLIVIEGDVGFVPKAEPSDAGKVLKVDSQGAPVWGDAASGAVEMDWYTATKADVEAAISAGKSVVMRYDETYCYLAEVSPGSLGTSYRWVSPVMQSSSYNGGFVYELYMTPSGNKDVHDYPAQYEPRCLDNTITVTKDSSNQKLNLSVANPLPASAQTDANKVLTVNSSGKPVWGSVSVPSVDQTYNASSTNAQSGTAVAGALANIKQVPASTSADADKVLTVNSSGTPEWATAQGGGGGTPALPSIDEAHHSYILTAHKHYLSGNEVVSADWVAPSFTYFYPAAYSDGSGYQISDWEWYQTLGQSIQTALLAAFENFDPWYYDSPYEVQARLGVNTSADISLRLPLDCSTSRNLSIQTDLEIGGSIDGMGTDITLYKMRGIGFIGNNNDAPVFLSTIHLPIVTDALYQDITNTYFSITPESGYNVSVPSADSYDPNVLKHFGIYITLYPNGQMSSRNIV